MKIYLIQLLILLGSSELLYAQRNQQPANPTLARNAPLSNRVSYSTSNRDSLRVDLINVDVPGLEIISCEQCVVSAGWFTNGVGVLEVVVKNRGMTKSNTATVWVEFGAFLMSGTGGFKKVVFSERKGVPALDPAQTTKLKFSIKSTLGDVVMHNQNKVIRVSLTQNGGSAWREN